MSHLSPPALLLAGLLAALFASASPAADIYECHDAAGRRVFSDQPCDAQIVDRLECESNDGTRRFETDGCRATSQHDNAAPGIENVPPGLDLSAAPPPIEIPRQWWLAGASAAGLALLGWGLLRLRRYLKTPVQRTLRHLEPGEYALFHRVRSDQGQGLAVDHLVASRAGIFVIVERGEAPADAALERCRAAAAMLARALEIDPIRFHPLVIDLAAGNTAGPEQIVTLQTLLEAIRGEPTTRFSRHEFEGLSRRIATRVESSETRLPA